MRLRSLERRAEEVLRLGGVTVHPLQFALVTADPDVREFLGWTRPVVEVETGEALERSSAGKHQMVVAART
jgi:hypothetical protein